MARIIVGGHTRNIGKTSVVAGIVRASAEWDWTAVKVTQFGHGVCSANGKSCHCSVEEHPFVILEEQNQEGRTDSSRFLLAGARKALWVRTKQGLLWWAMPDLKRRIEDDRYVILESNSIMQYIKPDLYLMVLDYGTEDFKESARRYLGQADAYLVIDNSPSEPAWKDIPFEPADKPVFPIPRGEYISDALMTFVRSRLGAYPSPAASSGVK